MTNEEQERIREFIDSFEFNRCLAVTLTMKKRSSGQKLDQINAPNNLRHFLNVINRKVYKNKFTRYNKKLTIIPVLEWSYGIEWHYHLIIEIPETIPIADLKKIIRDAWLGSHFGNPSTRLEEIYNITGWIGYITKFDHPYSRVDWENVSR